MADPVPVRRAPVGTLLRLAWRESRSARRRLLLYMSSISLGVAALVAIDSFAAGAMRAVRAQARAIFGADVQIHSEGTRPFAPALLALLDSLDAHGAAVARTAEFETMVRPAHPARADEGARLVEVRVVPPRWPLYGALATAPAGALGAMHGGGARAIVDSSVLLTLGIRVGDSLAMGNARFEVVGAIVQVPGDLGIQGPIRPRAFIPARHAGATGLLGPGSRVSHGAGVRLPAGVDPKAFLAPLAARLDSAHVHTHTVAEAEENLGASVERLRAFLGVVGLVAVLLGGVGVASGVYAYVRRKIDAVAALRCLGATGAQVLVIYGAQAGLMGLAGAAAGAALGVALERALPGVLADFMRFDAAPGATPRVELLPIALGVALGGWVALAFALRPLVALRAVAPLQVLRRDVDPTVASGWRRDRARVLVDVGIVATAVLVAAARARSLAELAATTGAVALVLLVLWLGASGLSRAARRGARAGARAGWPYVVRQGIANLHRPSNQTRAVVLTLGFGAFLVSTLFMVQSGVLAQFTTSAERSGGNIVFHDVQEDQVAGLDSLLRAAGAPPVRRIPVVAVRVAAVNGRSASALAADSALKDDRWAFVAEHHVTYRDTLVSTERVVAGRWGGAARAADEVSLDGGLAAALHVAVGDTVTWNVQGVPLVTRVTSVRDVRWAPFEPDFSAVFAPRALAPAPKMHVVLADVAEPAAAPRLQLRVAERYPNVGSLDLTFVRRTVREVTARVSGAIRFLSLFCIAMAVPVLLSAVAATSRDRVREGVLLKTLGASRRQIGGIVLTEYALLGVLGALTGMLLSFGGAWAVLRFAFGLPFTPVALPALAIAGAALALTTAVGMLGGREVFRRTPMEALRDG